jgi:HK97 gp10 family phage protein
MSSVTVQVVGLDELQDKLNRLPAEFSRKALKIALLAGGFVFKEAIRPLLRVTGKYSTGFLESQAIVRVKTNKLDEGEATITVSKKTHPGKKTSAIYELLYAEVGTVREPARPLIRPAFESSKGEALDAFVEVLRVSLEETFS